MNRKISPLLSLTLLVATLSGCASAPVVIRTGDKVEAGFTCRLPDGSLAATTRPDSDVAAEKKSPFYLPRNGADSIVLTAGNDSAVTTRQRVSFEDEIIRHLEPSLVGHKAGDSIDMELRAERYPSASPNERLTRMSLVRKRDKEQRVTREEYVKRSGREPEVGQPLSMEPLLNGTVSEVSDKEVVIRTSPQQGDALTTPFGPVEVRETAKQYEFAIKAEANRLVRVGGMVGRISEVDKDRELFSIDFGHPFGGESLRCAVQVGSVTSMTAIQSARPEEKQEVQQKSVEETPSAKNDGVLDPEAAKVFNKGMERMLAMGGQASALIEPARSGDLVTANFTVTLEDGSLVMTTRREISTDSGIKRVSWYREPEGFAPRELVADKQELMPGLGGALVGMKAGEKKHLVLSADKAFGQPDPQKLQQIPCKQSLPKSIRMSADEYVKRFSSFPVQGREVQLVPYFKSRVTEVSEKDAVLEFLAVDGSSFEEAFGTLTVAVADDQVVTTLKPRVGAPFPLKEGFGIVSATDGTTFTIDLNNPLAGKTLVLDLEVLKVTPAPTGSIDWIDDHDKGLEQARQTGRPVFLILHADWCGWCKKTFSETIPDPRITALKEHFVWVKVNSDKEQKYKQHYGQEGFPMMVLLNPDGSVLKKIDGYRDAAALREEIRAVLN
jgi:FKBP-type peptidyl-prolyl cis-trans isomerase 2